ncbi:MAG: sulfatase-like hydrolase/transferase, partial [Planctomycetota bacterium]
MTIIRRRPPRPSLLLLLALALALEARFAGAYVDPGTGGAVFSTLGPLLAMAGMLVVATLGFARSYVYRAARFAWRQKVWLALALGAAALVAAVVLASGAEKEGVRVITPKSAAPAPQKGARAASHDVEPVVSAFVERHRDEVRPAEPSRLFGPSALAGLEPQKREVGGRSRSCFVFERSGSIRAELVPAGAERLFFCVAPDGEEAPGRRVRVRVHVAAGPGGEDLLLDRQLGEPSGPEQWQPVWVELGQYAGRPIALRLEVVVPPGRHAGEEPAGWLVSAPRLVSAAAADVPNVLLYTIETLRRDHLSLYGYNRRTSPFLEKLALESVVFEDAYSQSSWTRPSIATLLTGLYPSQHRAIGHLHRLSDSLLLLPEVLRERGYVTGGFLTGVIASSLVFQHDQGFDLFVDERLATGEKVTEDFVRWLDEEEPKPFFAYIHTYDPHAPYEAPGRFREAFGTPSDGSLREEPRLESAQRFRTAPPLSP